MADALENGHSLGWQELYTDRIAAGIADADAGRLASEADVERVRDKYRPG